MLSEKEFFDEMTKFADNYVDGQFETLECSRVKCEECPLYSECPIEKGGKNPFIVPNETINQFIHKKWGEYLDTERKLKFLEGL
jgi:hypothetical protein